MKQRLTSAPVLLPFNETKDVLVTTAASDFAIGVVLEHIDSTGCRLGVVAYSSRKLHDSQLHQLTGKEKKFCYLGCFNVMVSLFERQTLYSIY